MQFKFVTDRSSKLNILSLAIYLLKALFKSKNPKEYLRIYILYDPFRITTYDLTNKDKCYLY